MRSADYGVRREGYTGTRLLGTRRLEYTGIRDNVPCFPISVFPSPVSPNTRITIHVSPFTIFQRNYFDMLFVSWYLYFGFYGSVLRSPYSALEPAPPLNIHYTRYLEYRQEHADDYTADYYAKERDDERFYEACEGANGSVHLVVVEIGYLREHLFELA